MSAACKGTDRLFWLVAAIKASISSCKPGLGVRLGTLQALQVERNGFGFEENKRGRAGRLALVFPCLSFPVCLSLLHSVWYICTGNTAQPEAHLVILHHWGALLSGMSRLSVEETVEVKVGRPRGARAGDGLGAGWVGGELRWGGRAAPSHSSRTAAPCSWC